MTVSVTSLGYAGIAYNAASKLTLSTSVPAGSLIVICVTETPYQQTINQTYAALTDSAGNTYQKYYRYLNNTTGAGIITFWYAYNCAALSSGNTITYARATASNNTGNPCIITGLYATGVSTAFPPLDTLASAGGASSSPSVAGATPNRADDLWVGVFGWASAVAFTQASGWSSPPVYQSESSGAYAYSGGGNLVATDQLAKTYSPTLGGSAYWGGFVVSFMTGGPVNVTGTGTVTAATTVSGVGAALASGAGSITGHTAVAAAGKSLDAAHGTITGHSAVAGVGKSLNPAHASIAGASVVAGVGRSLNPAHASITGRSTVAASGNALANAHAAITGSSTAAAAGKSLDAAHGTITGHSAVTGVGKSLNPAHAAIVGQTLVMGTDKATKTAKANIVGTASVAAVALIKTYASGNISGHTAVAGTTKATKASAASVAGHTAVAGNGAQKGGGAGMIAGATAVAAVSAAHKTAAATISGHTTASAVGRSLDYTTGTIVGHSTLAAASSATHAAHASIAGQSTVAAAGGAKRPAAGVIAGQTTIAGASAATKPASAAISGHTALAGHTSSNNYVAGTISGATTVAAAGRYSVAAAGAISGRTTVSPAGNALKAAHAAIIGHTSLYVDGYNIASGAGSITGRTTVTGYTVALAPNATTQPPTTLQYTIPAYLYQQYADDLNLQAFVAAYNDYTQTYVTRFNALNLPIYTGGFVQGALLDWVGTGLYGMPRPTLPYGSILPLGPLNTTTLNLNVPPLNSVSAFTKANPGVVTTANPHGYVSGQSIIVAGATVSAWNATYTITVLSPTTFSIGVNTSSYTTYAGGGLCAISTLSAQIVELNTLLNASSVAAGSYVTTDDIYRRILTWHFYKGDGKIFNIEWLKRRVARFLYGANGIDPGISTTYNISVALTSDSAATITIPSSAVSPVFIAAVNAGVLELPFQITWTAVT